MNGESKILYINEKESIGVESEMSEKASSNFFAVVALETIFLTKHWAPG